MSTHVITATDASRSFSSILNKVHYLGESYEIKRGKEVIARIVPAEKRAATLKVSGLANLFKNIPHLDKDEQEKFVDDIEVIRKQMHIEDDGKLWD